MQTELLGRKPVVESQLVTSNRKLEALSHLSQSLVRIRSELGSDEIDLKFAAVVHRSSHRFAKRG